MEFYAFKDEKSDGQMCDMSCVSKACAVPTGFCKTSDLRCPGNSGSGDTLCGSWPPTLPSYQEGDWLSTLASRYNLTVDRPAADAITHAFELTAKHNSRPERAILTGDYSQVSSSDFARRGP